MSGPGAAKPDDAVIMLACQNLEAGYSGKSVLRDIHLSVRAGEMAGLLGPNGSGKSTLLLCLSGTLRPLRGSVSLAGVLLSRFGAKERAQKIACVPQRPAYVPNLTVRELVFMGRYPYLAPFAAYTDEDARIVDKAMRETKVLEFAHRYLTELSGGELQRAFLACAFAQRTDVLLLDEATAGLDPARSVELFTLLRKRAAVTQDSGNASVRQCVVAAIHDLNLAALFCDRLIFLKQGRIVADGPTQSVVTRDILEDIYETGVTVFRHPVAGCPQMLLSPKT